MAPRFSVIGDANVDIILPVDSFPKRDLQVETDSAWLQAGGSSAIFSMAASRLGCDVTFNGLLGDDVFSVFVVREMEESRVKCRIRQRKDVSTGMTCSLVHKDRRSMITYRGSNSFLSVGDLDASAAGGELVHIGGFNLLDGLRKDVRKIFDRARERGAMASLDPNWDPRGWTRQRLDDLHRILPVTDFFFPDLEEGRAITGLDEPKKIVSKITRRCNGIVALKLGKNGCLVGHGSAMFKVKPFRVNAVQATGAGDIFDAAFLVSYLKTRDIESSSVFANAAGAMATTRLGKERFPTNRGITSFISQH